jgi:hypothetical protein
VTDSGHRVGSPPSASLSNEQIATLIAIADWLIPRVGDNPAGSEVPDYGSWLNRAVAARSRHLDLLCRTLDGLAKEDLSVALPRLDKQEPGTFRLLSGVIAAGYFMTPSVLARIGYVGQRRDPADLEQAADELGSGILDPVTRRGSLVRPVPSGDAGASA